MASPESPNIYVCDNCGYRYLVGEHEGVALDDQPASFECPECQSTKDHFQLFVPPDDDVAGKEEEEEERADPTGPRQIYTDPASPDVASLHRRFKKKRLDPQPSFQRYEVWSQAKNSKLIDSILLDMPIPPIYLAEDDDGVRMVIDGQQRLMAIFRYLDGEYALKDVSRSVTGMKFGALPLDLQERIENYTLSTVDIQKESDPEVKFILFQRLNEGATSLNDQELRNCVRRGPYNEFLKELAGEKVWRKLLRLKGTKPHPRMVDVELVLRFMAFRDQNYLAHPDKKTSKFLDQQMVRGETYEKKDYESARADFRRAIEVAHSVFGEHACRRFVPGDDASHDGKWDAKINRALMDVQLWGFLRHPKAEIVPRADAVRESAIKLMSDATFSDLIAHTISEAKRVERRFDLWKNMLDKVVGDSKSGPRLFDRKLKGKMFAENNECAICHQKIMDIDDAHVDHDKPHSKGGKTVPGNAQLTHQFCNRQKSAKEDK